MHSLFQDFPSSAVSSRTAEQNAKAAASGADVAAWFFQLRWVAILGQLLTVLTVRFLFGVRVPVVPLFSIIALTALSNLALMTWHFSAQTSSGQRSFTAWRTLLGYVMALDLCILTALLYFSGGPANPFTIFFLVNLCLAGVVLSSTWAWALELLAVLCFTILLINHWPVDALGVPDLQVSMYRDGSLTLAQQGLYFAFVTCSMVIVYFTTLVTSRLRQRDRQLRDAEQRRARGEKLEALGTLAAGAAHELASPLSTIAIVAKELEREAERAEISEAIRDDILLVRSEVDRCRAILDRMSADAGQMTWERPERVTVADLMERTVEGLVQRDRVRLELPKEVSEAMVLVPMNVLAQALRGIIKNAVEASPGEAPVQVLGRIQANGKRAMVELRIEDAGSGMSPELLGRVGEPFFTTKETGKGMGLGVFLARSVVERLEGTLEFRSKEGRGTTAIVVLPVIA